MPSASSPPWRHHGALRTPLKAMRTLLRPGHPCGSRHSSRTSGRCRKLWGCRSGCSSSCCHALQPSPVNRLPVRRRDWARMQRRAQSVEPRCSSSSSAVLLPASTHRPQACRERAWPQLPHPLSCRPQPHAAPRRISQLRAEVVPRRPRPRSRPHRSRWKLRCSPSMRGRHFSRPWPQGASCTAGCSPQTRRMLSPCTFYWSLLCSASMRSADAALLLHILRIPQTRAINCSCCFCGHACLLALPNTIHSIGLPCHFYFHEALAESPRWSQYPNSALSTTTVPDLYRFTLRHVHVYADAVAPKPNRQ